MKRRSFDAQPHVSADASAATAVPAARASTSTTGPTTSRPKPSPTSSAKPAFDVRYGTYESNQEMLAQVMSGNSGWDVVFPSNDFIQPMRQMGLLAPLNTRGPAAQSR